jgi:DNA-binding Lrp family transcriptional regulator
MHPNFQSERQRCTGNAGPLRAGGASSYRSGKEISGRIVAGTQLPLPGARIFARVGENLCGLAASSSANLAVSMNPVLKLLIEGSSSLTTGQMAAVAGLTEAEVQQHLEQLKKDKIFLGWRPVLDLSHEAAAAAAVRAVIEVKITPERGGGFNRFADRIARFDEVESCYLMSGGYDLLVFVKGSSLQKVAGFVSEKLSTIEGVLSTSTHFMLRCYKEQGFLLDAGEAQSVRLNVTP